MEGQVLIALAGVLSVLTIYFWWGRKASQPHATADLK
jgi:hypothetical protein